MYVDLCKAPQNLAQGQVKQFQRMPIQMMKILYSLLVLPVELGHRL